MASRQCSLLSTQHTPGGHWLLDKATGGFVAGGAVAGQGTATCNLVHDDSTEEAGGEAKCHLTHGCWEGPGRASKEPCTPGPELRFLSPSLSPFHPFHSWQLGTLSRPTLSQRMGFRGQDWPLPATHQGPVVKDFSKGTRKSHLFIVHSCRSTGLHKLRMSGFWSYRWSIWAQTLPEIVHAHC